MNKIFEMTSIELIAAGFLIFLLSAWLGKSFNNRILRRQKAKADAYIEVLESGHAQKLQSVEDELKVERHSAQLSRAHLIEKRVAVIDQGYKYLVDFDEAIHYAIRPMAITESTASQQETYDTALLRFTAFVSFFERNKVYFSSGIAKKVSKSHASMSGTLDLMRALLYTEQTLSNGINEELQSLFNKANREIERTRQDIESELRAILRIENRNTNTDVDNELSGLSMFS